MPLNDEEQLIHAARALSNKAIAEHDLQTLLNCCMDDVIIIRGNGDIIHNKIEAEKVWKTMFETQPEISFVREPEEIIVNIKNLLAWEKGKWIGINTYTSGGNYAAMWKKQNTEWKIQAELFVFLE